MKIILQSESFTFLNTIQNDKVYLFTQFFIPNSNDRYNEVKLSLKENVNNKSIDQIILLNEMIYDDEQLGIESNKIKQVNINKRLKFSDVFHYIRSERIRGYMLLINCDICFANDSINKLKKTTLHCKKQIACLLRYEYNEDNISKSTLFGPRYDSQDAWIFHSNYLVPEFSEKIFSFEFGKPGCDNKIIYLMAILGYEIINDPKNIQILHIHKGKNRSYTILDAIYPPVGVVIPYGIENNQLKNKLGINLQKFLIWSNNFETLHFHDNSYLHSYISEKISNNQPFIIPRISGIENNVAVFARVIHSQLHHDIENLRQYIKKILPVMKNNAGVRLSSESSVLYYSNLYLSAFDKCEIFAGWEPYGEYVKHIIESHSYMQNTYKGKPIVWSYCLDIFHYIYNNPWTQALKNKRILLISPFTKTLEEQIPIRHLMYNNVNLFPNCEFILLKPPQTQADQTAREFGIEFEEFKNNVNEIIDKFDVALVSCGGYANPICSHIYSKGKSAIYVGGVLQMYFGILGNRWLNERPDIVYLFHNKHWKRPKSKEKPLHYKKVENGCYW
jgi:hypothetical protein